MLRCSRNSFLRGLLLPSSLAVIAVVATTGYPPVSRTAPSSAFLSLARNLSADFFTGSYDTTNNKHSCEKVAGFSFSFFAPKYNTRAKLPLKRFHALAEKHTASAQAMGYMTVKNKFFLGCNSSWFSSSAASDSIIQKTFLRKQWLPVLVFFFAPKYTISRKSCS